MGINKIGIYLVMLLALSISAIAAVDDIKSLQVYNKGGMTVAEGTTWENGTRVYDRFVEVACDGNIIGSTNKYEPTFYIARQGTPCSIGSTATVIVEGYRESIIVTHKHIHIGKKVIPQPVVAPIVEVITPPVIVDTNLDNYKKCNSTALDWYNSHLLNCSGLNHKKLSQCLLDNWFVAFQYNNKLNVCKEQYNEDVCSDKEGYKWEHNKCVKLCDRNDHDDRDEGR